MKLSNYTSPELLLAGLTAQDKRETLAAMVDRLLEAGKVADGETLLNELMAREVVESTGIGGGIALPHARSQVVAGSLVTIARLAQPIAFDSVDGEPVDLVFLLVGSRELPGQQLRILARISRLVRIQSFLGDLREADTPAALFQALLDAEAQHF